MRERDAIKGYTAIRAKIHSKEMVYREWEKEYEVRGGGGEDGCKDLLHYTSV